MFNATEKTNTAKKSNPVALGVIIILVIVLPLVLLVVFAGDEESTPAKTASVTSEPKSDSAKTTSESPEEVKDLGAEGYLRLPGENDANQGIVLTESKETYELVTKAMLANDAQGLAEIPGAFGVPVGTKVKVVDTAFGLRRVRILEVPTNGDQSTIGMAGWVAKEWVVNK